ncbi:MAG: DUF2917 domain-containing protein [Burkholderiales bacterium]|nr:DUF2917 domain-containing protein [Burkholderiales bacterium]
MRMELDRGPVRLTRRQFLRIREAAGRRICVREGAVWITEASEPGDIVLQPGACYAIKRDGLALVTGLAESVVTVN